jgi:hypothetical protein
MRNFMLRDKIKTKNYFIGIKNDGIDWLENLREMRSIVIPNKLNAYYIDLDVTNTELFKACYSLGDSINSIFEYFKEGLHYYSLSYTENDGIFTIIDHLSLAVLFENRKDEFIDDVKVLFDKYVQYSEEDENVQDGYIETLALYLLEGRVENFRSRLEYLNMIGNDADSVIEAQKFWYYAHSEASWYDTHKTDDAYYGYWSFDTAALCKMRGIYDERFKDLDFFPYDLLVQEDK